MFQRYCMRVLAIVLLTTSFALGQGDVLDLDLLWRRGQFELARELIAAHMQAGNDTHEFLANAADCSKEMQDWSIAATLYADLAEVVDADHGAYFDARRNEWHCRWRSVPDADASWVQLVRAEIAMRLDATRVRSNSERMLALELEYVLDAILGTAALPSVELRTGFPESEVVLVAAKDACDALGAEASDEHRLQLIDGFLANFPGNYWCHFAWRYKLYTAWRLRDDALLRDVAESYIAAYPESPRSHGAVGRYYFEADIAPVEGFDHAQRTVELYDIALGINGSLDNLRRIQNETIALPLQHDYLPANKRALFLEYIGSRYSLARYRHARGEYEDVLSLCEPVIALSPFTTEEEHTLAPFHLACGNALAAQDGFVAAYDHYLAAAILGDTRNRYAIQAEERLTALATELLPGQIDAAQSAAIPAELIAAGMNMPLFTDVTEAQGLSQGRGKRVAWGDVDLDGDPDLLVDGRALYRNDAPGNGAARRFRDASRQWALGGKGTGGVFADIDNDGDLDFYRTAHGKRGDKLLRNDTINRAGTPALRFSDITIVAGDPADDHPSEGAAWLDFDNDGFIDLYVGNYEIPIAKAGRYGVGTPDHLYRNTGGTFFELQASDVRGMTTPFGMDRACRGAVSVADFDGDGDQDIFTGNYRLHENYLWSNDDGVFSNVARLTNSAGKSVDAWWGHTIGSAWGDIDNDGDLDLFAANLAHPRYAYASDKSQLLMNEQGLLGVAFSDQRSARGIRFEETHAGPVFLDCNNDGHLDLYITSIYTGRRSFLYLNDGAGHFHDVTYLAGARVLDGWGVASADYDGDGDVDLAVGTGSGIRLLRNDSPATDWLSVRAVGGALAGVLPTGQPFCNAAGIGARVTLYDGTMVQMREIQSGASTGSGNELIAHFGLGEYTGGRLKLTVRFPSGRSVVRNVSEINSVIVVSETEAALQAAEGEANNDAETTTDAEASDDGKGDAPAAINDSEDDALSRRDDSRGN